MSPRKGSVAFLVSAPLAMIVGCRSPSAGLTTADREFGGTCLTAAARAVRSAAPIERDTIEANVPLAVDALSLESLVVEHAKCTKVDKVATIAALRSVPYADCGPSGAARISITFSPSGEAVLSFTGGIGKKVRDCIQRRFRSARAPAVCASRAATWSIDLR